MTVFTDFYVATLEEVLEVFSWISVPPVGDEPISARKNLDFEIYETWRLKQPTPRPDEVARAAMARLPMFESKFVDSLKLHDLKTIFLGPSEMRDMPTLLRTPSQFYSLEQVDAELVRSLAAYPDVPFEPGVQNALVALTDEWGACGDPAEFTRDLMSLAQLAAKRNRDIFLFTSGYG